MGGKLGKFFKRDELKYLEGLDRTGQAAAAGLPLSLQTLVRIE